MDCEKFDQHVIDELYEELDELTHAALKRHVEGCSRCAPILSGLRATRDVGILPIEELSDDLEARILEAAFIAQKKAPWPRKVLRGLAWAGSHAMRPQLAMAALFFLVIGSSLLLLRAKPGTIAPVRVTERGAPALEAEAPVAVAAATAMPSSATIAAAPSPADSPQDVEGAAGPTKDKAAEVARSSDKEAARLALTDARTVRDGAGCAAAVSKYDEIGARFPGTGAAADAMWEAAS
ncbi:MAG: zf-HC2 domain-containing protein, partial [Byssovorax sp.]